MMPAWGELDAGFAPLEFQAVDVGGDEVDEEQTADEVAAWHGHKEATDAPDRDPRTIEFLLHRVDAEIDLREGGREDEDERKREQDDGEVERDEEVAQGADERGSWRGGGPSGF
jgi:hypothetical protein